MLACDAVAFDRLIAAGRPADALALYRGDLLDGVFVEEAAEFERWLEDERERLRRAAAAAAATLAGEEEAAGRPGDAAVWRRRVLGLRPGRRVGPAPSGGRPGHGGTPRRRAQRIRAGRPPVAGGLRDRAFPRDAAGGRDDPEPAPGDPGIIPRAAAPEAAEVPVPPDSAAAASPPGRARTRRALLAGVLLAAVPGAIWLARPREPQADDTVGPPIGSVAVLPLANRSDDSTGEYLADGITDDLISRLARVPGLRVAARTSVFTYKRTTDPVRHIANRLNVDAIVEGTVRRTADSVRVDVRLLDPGTDVVLWASDFEGTPADLPRIEERILEGTTRTLGYRHEARPVAAAGGAYDSYLKGKYYFDKYEIDDVRRSLSISPRRWTATRPSRWATPGCRRPTPSCPPAGSRRTRRCRGRAPRPNGPWGSTPPCRRPIVALSRVPAYWERDWDGAERSLRRALVAGPGLATVHEAYGLLLTFQGRIDSALAHLRLAQRLDPLSPAIGFEAVWPLLMGQRYRRRRWRPTAIWSRATRPTGWEHRSAEVHALQGDYATAIPI